MPKNFVRLKEDNPFYCVFEGGRAPIKELVSLSARRMSGGPVLDLTRMVQLGGIKGETEAYFLDWKRCSIAQQGKIAAIAVRVRRAGTPNKFHLYMTTGGDMPIRKDQTTGVESDMGELL